MDDLPFDPALEEALRNHPLPSPRPEARERILGLCGAASAQRIRTRRRVSQITALGVMALAVFLFSLDAMIDRRDGAQVAQIVYGSPSARVNFPRSSALLAFRARSADIASLLRDPQSP